MFWFGGPKDYLVILNIIVYPFREIAIVAVVNGEFYRVPIQIRADIFCADPFDDIFFKLIACLNLCSENRRSVGLKQC